MPNDGDNVSVIIRCKNEERWIGYSIQSVLDHIPNAEIIVVDNHSTDDSMDIVKMFETWHDVSRYSVDDYTPGKAINWGVKRSHREHVLVLSSHCCLTRFNIEQHISDLDRFAAIFGKQVPWYRGRKINKRYIWTHFGDEQKVNMWSDIENRLFLHNAMCMYKKSVLEKHPFDESLYGKEDRYWAKEMVNNKSCNILYDPLMECNHHWTRNGATWKGIG